jgi:hypothetical protein
VTGLMVTWGASVLGVLLALVLLGIEVWVVGIAALAYVVSREVVTVPVLLRAASVVAGSTLGYIAVVALIGDLLSR